MTSWHFGFCDLFTEISIYQHSFGLNITKNQSTSPRLLIQSNSPSSRQLEKNGLLLTDFAEAFSNLDFIRV